MDKCTFCTQKASLTCSNPECGKRFCDDCNLEHKERYGSREICCECDITDKCWACLPRVFYCQTYRNCPNYLCYYHANKCSTCGCNHCSYCHRDKDGQCFDCIHGQIKTEIPTNFPYDWMGIDKKTAEKMEKYKWKYYHESQNNSS